MYVDDQGGIEGSITGGCVEGAVAAAAMDMLEAERPRRSWSPTASRDELAGTVGLMCGGIVHIFIHEIRPRARARPCWRPARRRSTHTPAALSR